MKNKENLSEYLLSDFGKKIFFSKTGILGQTWEARKRAYHFNATLGEGMEDGEPMVISSLYHGLETFPPRDIFMYAPPDGIQELRVLWKAKMLRENPSLQGKHISTPVVTSGMTHCLSLIGDLFINQDDCLIVHDHFWENYRYTFGYRNGAEIVTYPMFLGKEFHVDGLRKAILEQKRDKIIVLLNFPNNPSGYSPDNRMADEILNVVKACAEAGKKILVICDDAYYGFRYDDHIVEESLFARLAGLHPGVMPVRIDGITKEMFAGGMRVGFITFAGNNQEELYDLEQKVIGSIRAAVSSGNHLAQSILLRGMKSAEIYEEMKEKREILRERGILVRHICEQGSAKGLWESLPFNSGYFFCLTVRKAAEAVRESLLENYGIGVIACSDYEIRIALPCLELHELREFFDILDDAIEKAKER